MKEELVKVRSYDELISDDTNKKWKQNVFQVFVNNIGKERADKIAEYMGENENCKTTDEKSGCDKSSGKDYCKKK
jgi:hypothetical protein